MTLKEVKQKQMALVDQIGDLNARIGDESEIVQLGEPLSLILQRAVKPVLENEKFLSILPQARYSMDKMICKRGKELLALPRSAGLVVLN